MPLLVLDQQTCDDLLRQRQKCGGDRFDEVWEGTYIMNPLASVEHQRIVMELSRILYETVAAVGGGQVLPGANVAAKQENWEQDYRCPDVVVVLPGAAVVDIGPALVGGPNLVVEVLSPSDRSREKLAFYAALGVKEVWLVDATTKEIELFALNRGSLTSVGISTPQVPQRLASQILPLTLETIEEPHVTRVRISRTDTQYEILI